jgi:AraC-like DNA-binding protein
VGECLQIRLDPAAAAAVLGTATELTGAVVSLEDVWGRDAGRTEDRLRAAASWGERFTIAADLLGRRLGSRPTVAPEVAFGWRQMRTSRGRARVDGLADEVGWSRKRLSARFRAQLGITPPPASPLRVATSTSPTFTARSSRSSDLLPWRWPSRRGSRLTTLRGRLHRRLQRPTAWGPLLSWRRGAGAVVTGRGVGQVGGWSAAVDRRDPLARANRRSVAGSATRVRSAADGLWPLPSLATRWSWSAVLTGLQARADAAGLITWDVWIPEGSGSAGRAAPRGSGAAGFPGLCEIS